MSSFIVAFEAKVDNFKKEVQVDFCCAMSSVVRIIPVLEILTEQRAGGESLLDCFKLNKNLLLLNMIDFLNSVISDNFRLN